MRRIFRYVMLLLIVAAMIPAYAQTGDTVPDHMPPELVGAPGIGDEYFPLHGNGGYDVRHYDIVLAADTDTNTLNAVTTIEATATQELARFNLDFSRYTVESVTVYGDPAGYEYEGREFVITPALTIPAGADFTVEVAYSGQPSGTGWNFHPGGVIVAGEPVSASGWFPVNEHPLDKATYSYAITVPEPFVAAANGILVETVENPDGTLTYVWQADDPMASYLTTIAIGDFVRYEYESASGVPVRDYIYADAPQTTLDIFALAPEMIDVLEVAFGPYPFEVYGVVVHDLSLNFALETQTLSVFGRTFVNERVAVHELAHQWFGNSVSLERWQDIWLNEGFASYAELIWLEHTGGESALNQGVRAFYRNMAQFVGGGEATRSQVLELLRVAATPAVTLPAADAQAALATLFGDRYTQAELAAALDAAGAGDTVTGPQFVEAAASFDFDTLFVAPPQAYELLITLGRDDLAADFTLPVVGDPTPDALFSGVVYQRGALTLHALRLRIGDDAFFDLLRTYTAAYHDDNAGTDDFITLAEEAAGEPLDDLFDPWLYAPALPDMPELGLFYDDFVAGE